MSAKSKKAAKTAADLTATTTAMDTAAVLFKHLDAFESALASGAWTGDELPPIRAGLERMCDLHDAEIDAERERATSMPSEDKERALRDAINAIRSAVPSFAQLEAIAASIKDTAAEGLDRDRPLNTSAALERIKALADAAQYVAADMGNLLDCQREEVEAAAPSPWA